MHAEMVEYPGERSGAGIVQAQHGYPHAQAPLHCKRQVARQFARLKAARVRASWRNIVWPPRCLVDVRSG